MDKKWQDVHYGSISMGLICVIRQIQIINISFEENTFTIFYKDTDEKYHHKTLKKERFVSLTID